MILIAEDRGWEFTFDGEYVPVDTAFNEATFGPALLVAAAKELQMRQIGGDLGVRLHHDAAALFGSRVSFDEGSAAPLHAQMWRLNATAVLIESLPRQGRTYQLDPLPAILPTMQVADPS